MLRFRAAVYILKEISEGLFMPTTDIFKFESPDLVNLQKWYKRAPKQVTRAAVNVMNTLAFGTRIEAIANIKAKTITRSPKFVDRSIRVTKARHGQPLNSVESSTGSIDLSGKGRSSGFEELETGSLSKGNRAPTIQARMGQEKRSVLRGVRMDRLGRMIKHKQFKGASKAQRVAQMLHHIRKQKSKTPFVIPSGLSSSNRLSGMPPGVWRNAGNGNLRLVNPFKGKRDKVKRIGWMNKAVHDTASVANIRQEWRKETDIILKAWR